MEYSGTSVTRLIKIIEKGLSEPSRGALVWVGAGLSIPAGYPSLGQLAAQLKAKSLEPLDDGLEPLQTVDAFVKANGKGLLLQQLTDLFNHKLPRDYHVDLMRLPWKGILTTNYDELLEDALKQVEEKDYLKVTLDDNLDLTAGPKVPLYKVHGDIGDFKNVVLDGKSYATFNTRYPLLRADFESHLRKHSLVFFGCSMTDPRLLKWLNKLGRKGREVLQPSCAVMTEGDWQKIPTDDRALLEEGNIKPVLLKTHAEIPDLIRHLVEQIVGARPGEDLAFTVSFASDEKRQWRIETEGGVAREVDVPWTGAYDFVEALRQFTKRAEEPAREEGKRATLHTHAVHMGEALGQALLGDDDRKRIYDASGRGGLPPVVTLASDDDLILSLPWELLRLDGQFAVRDGRIDMVRTTTPASPQAPTLSKPDRYLKLLVNVSAPEGSSGHLNYEEESYRLHRALHDHSEIVFTELGSADDLVNGVAEHAPLGVHFSGHGGPGKLSFEDDEGQKDDVAIHDLLRAIRTKAPGASPKFFYLASCHGNDPGNLEEGQVGSTISAAQLHREGVTQVVGYYGPIVDALSTVAEVAIYKALGEGRTTLDGVRQARAALAGGVALTGKATHRAEVARERANVFPFAWAQLVLYHRGPHHALGKALPPKYVQEQEAHLERRYEGTEQRRFLATGFIGRRRELHAFRRRVRQGQRVFVFQGLGGLGKSTLAFKAIPILARDRPTMTVWCHEIEDAEDPARELTNRLSAFGQELFGGEWGGVVFQVDRMAALTEPQRFAAFLGVILQALPHLVIYLDNMESLLNGPDNDDPDAFGAWKSAEAEAIWQTLVAHSGDTLSVVASCRYRNAAFNDPRMLRHVPAMGPDAIFRMMGWFDGLRRLSAQSRARLVARLDGHPRAVEFLNDLIVDALRVWEDRYGEWVHPATDTEIAREWADLIAPALPQVAEKLRANLLLDAIWTNVLDDPARRMLVRMTQLRRPWDWDLMMQLGEPEDPPPQTEEAIQRLRATSLVGQALEWRKDRWAQLFQVHPTTARFILQQVESKEAEALAQATYRRVGTYLEALAEQSPDIRVDLDAGHYLFACGEYDRAYELLGSSSDWFQQWGRVREGIELLEPFEKTDVFAQIAPELRGRMLGTQGLAYADLGQVEQAITYYEQALVIAREIGDRRGEGNTLGNLGTAYHRLGQVEQAITYYEQALVIRREIGDRRGEGNDLGNLGNAYASLGQVEQAITYHEQALKISREIGDRRGEGNTLGNLGIAYADLGQVEQAITYHEQALKISREIGDRRGEGNDLGNLGNAYASLGQVEQAITYHEQALVIAREIKDPRMEAIVRGNLERLDGDGSPEAG